MKRSSGFVVSFVLFWLLAAFPAFPATLLDNSHAPAHSLPLVPGVKSLLSTGGEFNLGGTSRIVAVDDKFLPLARLLSDEIFLLTGLRLKAGAGFPQAGDIVLELGQDFEGEEYSLLVSDRAIVRGGNYQAAARGTVTLLQSLTVNNASVSLPRMTLHDRPNASYRGLMVDLARKWHTAENVKQLITLCRWYKIRYLHLHLTDNESFTFPSQAFPKLPTKKYHYTLEELHDLENFANERGVTLVPEFEMPYHANSMILAMPKLFAVKDYEKYDEKIDRKYDRLINMGREEVYSALDKIIGEMADVFRASPYFHVGGDEARLEMIENDPEAKDYMRQHGLKNVKELYRHFLVRIDEIVKRHGKQMIAWEGFEREGEVRIPKDVVVMSWWTANYLPNLLVEDGYHVISASCKPLYVVNAQKDSLRSIYDWNMYLWANHSRKVPAYHPIQLKLNDLVLGAEVCSWEQEEKEELPSLRKRLAVLSERLWNTEASPDFENFASRLNKTDQALENFVQPVSIRAEGLCDPVNRQFLSSATLTLSALQPTGTLRYTLHGLKPSSSSPVYGGPLRITSNTLVQAGWFVDDRQMGCQTRLRFERIKPLWNYALYDFPIGETLPDLAGATPSETGRTNKLMVKDRVEVGRPAVMRFERNFEAPLEGAYLFSVTSSNPVRLEIDGRSVLECRKTEHKEWMKAEPFQLKKGSHRAVVTYYYREGFQTLDFRCVGPDKEKIPSW